jgi:hypothetical protein
MLEERRWSLGAKTVKIGPVKEKKSEEAKRPGPHLVLDF